MKKPVVLYSIQSYLAYYINNVYYKEKHYVCAPFFDYNQQSRLTPRIPYTSNPIDIYKSFKKDISIFDNHYIRNEIGRNVVGLLRGATKMYESNRITEEECNKIKKLIKSCQNDDNYREYFRPLIYVIPYSINENRIKKVSFEDSALKLSEEYIIESLPLDAFNVIDLSEEKII